MPVDRERLASLATEIGRFYVRDKAMRRAQEAMQRALDEGGDPPQALVDAYLKVARRYFAGFAREAQAHLVDVERRLGRASQVQFNLTAERGVTARRVEATQGVLTRVEELAAE
jgi:hypothetical protein